MSAVMGSDLTHIDEQGQAGMVDVSAKPAVRREAIAEGFLIAAPTTIDRLLADPNTPLVLCVGPEGGWTDEELDAAREAKATLIGVGRHTLRIETAALALAALVSASRKVGD